METKVYDYKTVNEKLEELFPYLSSLRCDACKEVLVDAKLLECGHTVCGYCVMKRNKHCLVCGYDTDGVYFDNEVVNHTLKHIISDYDEMLDALDRRCNNLNLFKDYMMSVRFTTLFNYVCELLHENKTIPEIIEAGVETGYLEKEVKYAIHKNFDHGYFALLGDKVIFKGSISSYLLENWEDITDVQRLYLYVLSTTLEKCSWKKVLNKMDVTSIVSPDLQWVINMTDLDCSGIDLDDVPSAPISDEILDFETDKSWDDSDVGFTESEAEEFEDDEDDDESEEDEDEDEDESVAESDTESVETLPELLSLPSDGENTSSGYTTEEEVEVKSEKNPNPQHAIANELNLLLSSVMGMAKDFNRSQPRPAPPQRQPRAYESLD